MKNNQASFFVSGIGTEIGKTVASAILVEALNADYWKPVQAGDLDYTDTDKVKEWVSHSHFRSHPERFRLQTPASPHAAAAIDGVDIQLDNFKLPETSRPLIVEGAGGLMVPLNDRDCMIDLMLALGLPVILVSRHYLGSINHSLLSVLALQARGLRIAGILFNGDPVPTTEKIISLQANVPIIGRIEEMAEVNKVTIAQQAQRLQKGLKSML